MTDLTRTLTELRRPRMLVGAARHGLPHYRRERDLRGLLSASPRSAEAARQLLNEESRLEAARSAGVAGYSISRHIAVLTALLAESALSASPA